MEQKRRRWQIGGAAGFLAGLDLWANRFTGVVALVADVGFPILLMVGGLVVAIGPEVRARIRKIPWMGRNVAARRRKLLRVQIERLRAGGMSRTEFYDELQEARIVAPSVTVSDDLWDDYVSSLDNALAESLADARSWASFWCAEYLTPPEMGNDPYHK